MDIPGTEEDYKKELTSILPPKYEPAEFEVSRFSQIFQQTHEGIILKHYEFVGLIDQRSITPELLEDLLSDFHKKYKNNTGWLAAPMAQLSIVGVTDEITTATREFLSEGLPGHYVPSNYAFYIVDVASGTIVEYVSAYPLQDNIKEYLLEPLE